MAGLSGANAADVYAATIEYVRKGEIPALFQKNNNKITAKIKPSETFKPSGRLGRVPVEVYPGGNFSMVNMDGGDIPNGSGGLVDELKIATKEMAFIYRFTDRAEQQTETPNQSVKNVAKQTMRNMMDELSEMEEILFFQNGSGKITAGATSTTTTSSKTEYTFNKSTDKVGLIRLRVGMSVLVFDSSNVQVYNSTDGATGHVYIESMDYTTGKVLLSKLLNSTSPAAGDTLVINGQTVSTQGSDFSGIPPNTTDACVHGLPYFNDATTSTYVQGKLKSAWPQLVPSYIDGVGMTHTSRLVTNMQHLLADRFGEDAAKGLIAVFPRAQADALHVEQLQVSVVNSETIGSKADHRTPSELTGPQPTTNIAGVPHYVSSRQRRDRVDFINPKLLLKAERLPITPIKKYGSAVWQALSLNPGKHAYAKEGGFHMAFDWGSLKPGCGAYVDNLSTASGYKA